PGFRRYQRAGRSLSGMAQSMNLANAQRPETAEGLVNSWYQQLEAHQANCEASVLDESRQHALAELAEAGRLPGRKDEHWKYFSLQSLEALQPELNPPSRQDGTEVLPVLVPDASACRLAQRLGNCFASPAGLRDCLPAGVRLLELQEALADEGLSAVIAEILADEQLKGPGRVFQALNTAALGTALDNTLVIHVAKDADAGRIQLEWLPPEDHSDAAFWLDNCRLFIIQEAGSRLQLLETFSTRDNDGPSASLLNQVTQVRLAGQAVFDHLRVQLSASTQHLFQFSEVQQHEGSEYRYTGFELGGGLVRNELVSKLNGANASADLAAAFIGNGESIIDHHLVVDHQAPKCRSEQNFRGVLGGRSKGVFNGKALIRPGADGSSVRQSNANLLLSDLAEMNTKPELEIYADEVEASHGATVGQLDEQALFYLQTRGLAEEDARRILTGAFCRAIGARLSDRKLVEQIEALLDAAMPGIEPSNEVAA
ncbi:MAG TPA: Fe-S cluster assembly protein SufD, partial [Xanthomonadales bacterium]|nr:Fe-S cluster assembly protein SufD [Xanthomonadales bacterium]